MKKSLSKYVPWLLTLCFGVVVFLFWRYRYPFALTYQEQFQLFLFDDDYFLQRLAEPGGGVRYIAEFLVQFYNSVTIGALILAVLFMLLQRLTWQVTKSPDSSVHWYPLSFLPAILLWYAMGDESVLLTYVIALILALLLIWARPSGKYVRWVTVLIGIPVIYWLIGPMAVVVALCWMPLSAIYAVACILVSAWVLPYPLLRLALGLGYYRFPETMPYVLLVLPLLIALLYFCRRWLQGRGDRFLALTLTLVVLLTAVLLVPRGYDTRKYDLIEYDYLVRIKDWQGIISKSEQKQPDLPMSVSATNLALAMTNQLGERAFDFYQRGVEGLLPKFERNFTTAQLTGEIYYYMGLVNTAQRFAFESMESLPDYAKSARVVKRLAETNLINGEYKVAEKYLLMLQKTIFYRPWAQRMLAMLGNEQQINAHPVYGKLRSYRLEEDFLFSDQELDKICGQLFIHNPQNQMAVQYLLMAPLLDRDVPRFMQYVQVVQNRIQYNPRSCQEAIAFAFMQQRRQPPQGVVSPIVLQRLNSFARVYSAGKDSPELEQFRNTVWYYLTVGK